MNKSFYFLLIVLTICNLFSIFDLVSSVSIKYNNRDNDNTINFPIIKNDGSNDINLGSTSTGDSIKSDAYCTSCIDFLDDYLPILVKIISEYGVIESCSKICGLLNNTVETDLCITFCDSIGVTKFWNIFVANDINPFYACQEISACDEQKNSAVNFLNFEITPNSGQAGETFDMNLSFFVVNKTGAGQIAFIIYFTETQSKFIYYQLMTGYPANSTQTVKYSFETVANSTFVNGQYPVTVAICDGECGTIYSTLINQTTSSFTINNPTPSPTLSPTPTPTATNTQSPTPSPTPSTSSESNSNEPTPSPTQNSNSNSNEPTQTPTQTSTQIKI